MILNALKEYKNFATLTDFARYLGIKPQALSNWYARNTLDLHILSDKFPEIDGNWLLTGEGSMLKTIVNDTTQRQCRDNAETMPTTPTAQNEQRRTLPLIPIDAVAGYNGVDTPGINILDCTQYEIPDFDSVNADFLIRVSGSSMYPKYSSGDILACRRIDEITFLQWGKIYVIDSRQGAMVKRIFEIEDDPTCISCVSDNEKYPPFRLPKSEIRSLSIVVGAIRLE